MGPKWIPIWILYGPLYGSHMDPYMDYMDPIRSLDGPYMDPCKDPIWIPIWILCGSLTVTCDLTVPGD